MEALLVMDITIHFIEKTSLNNLNRTIIVQNETGSFDFP